MYHRIVAGFFDEDAAKSSHGLRVTKALDRELTLRLIQDFGFDGDGKSFRVGKDVLTLEAGFVDCPWLTVGPNQQSVEFMLRLHEETGCMFVEGHGNIVTAEELRESLGQ